MDALLKRQLNSWRRSWTAITQECCEQYWTSPGGNTQQGTNYTATCLPSRKLSKLDEPVTQDTAGEAGTSSSVMYSYGHPHIAEQKQDDQLEPTYSSYVRIWDVSLKTYQTRWTIGRSGERGSGISVPAARHDDDDDLWYICLIPLSFSSLFSLPTFHFLLSYIYFFLILPFFFNPSFFLLFIHNFYWWFYLFYITILNNHVTYFWIQTLPWIYIYIYIYIYIWGSLNKFPDFFRIGTFIDSTHMKL